MTTLARTVFLGSGAFAVPIVAALSAHPLVELVGVVTAPAETPVGSWAEEHALPTLRPRRLRDAAAVAQVAALAPDLIVLADYGQIVPQALLDLPAHGALNLHPSLLPRHRGAVPIAAAILAGDHETGVSLMLMDAGLDTGPILAQEGIPLAGHETAPQLEDELARAGARLLGDNLERWLGGAILPVPQDHAKASLTRLLRREDGRLDPARTAAELERQVRAHQPWPGSFLETNVGRLVVWQAHVAEERRFLPSGHLYRTPTAGLGLIASDRVLELDEVQLAGSRRMSGEELLRGRPGIRLVTTPAAGA